MMTLKYANQSADHLPLTVIHGCLSIYNITSGKLTTTDWLDDVSYTFLGDNARLFFDSSSNQTIIWPNGTLFRTFSALDNSLLTDPVDAPDMNPQNHNEFVLSDYLGGNMLLWKQDFDQIGSIPILTKVSSVPLPYHFSPIFSPNGTKLATVATNSTFAHGNLVVIDIASKNLTQITHLKNYDSLEVGVAWASDGLSVFAGGSINGKHGIYQIDVESGDIHSILNGSTRYTFFVGSVCVNKCNTCGPGYSCYMNICSPVCEDINECPTVNCSQNEICKNLPGSYTCECAPSFVQCANHTCVSDASLCIPSSATDCTTHFPIFCSTKNICAENASSCAIPDRCETNAQVCFDGSCSSSNYYGCAAPPSTLCPSNSQIMCESGKCVSDQTKCNGDCAAQCWNTSCVSDLSLCSQVPSFIKPVPFQIQVNPLVSNLVSLASSGGSIFGSISIPTHTFSPGTILEITSVNTSVLYSTQKLDGWEDILSNIISPLVNITVNSGSQNLGFNVSLSWMISQLPEDLGSLCLGFINETTSAWECVDSQFTISENGTICASTSHFTTFAVLLRPTSQNSESEKNGVNKKLIVGVAAGIVFAGIVLVLVLVGVKHYRRKRESKRLRSSTSLY
eukprot:Phypoly_transcript_04660.p1 GENE.Phypoly_transcript_04660~~Phypoly_transcript_04660.p1  ORF type:complete len:622 (+),score=46.69 Phypoly_transcript_04660:236-2101(+)